MTIEPTIKIGDIFTLIGFLVIGLGIIWTMRGELKMLSRDVQAHGVKIDKLEQIVTAQAVQNERMNMFDRQLDDIRHGRGFVIHREFKSATSSILDE
jgi:hypothetical protein